MKRALIFIAAAAIVVATVGFVSAGRACAHNPRFACSPRGQDGPIQILHPEKSWAFYGHLSAAQEDRYAVDIARSIDVPVQILIDQRDAGNPARPVAKITDPSGRLIDEIDLAQGHPFFEPFSRVTYLESPDRDIPFPARWRFHICLAPFIGFTPANSKLVPNAPISPGSEGRDLLSTIGRHPQLGGRGAFPG